MHIHIRQKLLIYAICFSLILALQSCKTQRGDPLKYRHAPFTADISGVISTEEGHGLEFKATVEFFGESGVENREFCLVYHSPAAISGISVRRYNDSRITVSLGEIEQSLPNGESILGFIKTAEMLDPSEEILGISSISGSSVGLERFQNLTVVETQSCRLYFDPQGIYPIKAEYSDGGLFILLDEISFRT